MLTKEHGQKVQELFQEMIGLTDRLAEVKQELAGFGVRLEEVSDLPTVTVSAAKKSAPAANGVKRRGRPPKNPAAAPAEGGSQRVVLGDLLVEIAEKARQPLKLDAFVAKALEAGYETKSTADKFPNLVYQSLNKLVKQGMFVRDPETRQYSRIQKAA